MRNATVCLIAVLVTPLLAQAAHLYGDDQIEVTVGEPFTISSSPSYYNFPTLKQISAKELFVAIWASPDANMEDESVVVAGVWTHDGGRTWDKPVVLKGAQSGAHSWVRRKDGTCVWLSYFLRPLGEKVLAYNVGHSKDGRTYTWAVGRATLPEPIKWDAGPYTPIQFSRTVLEMDDGSLLATMYGFFAADYPRFRCMLVRSTDDGLTWEYYSTIAFSPDAPGEGFDEPVVVRTSDGELLCVMRVGGLPMWSCRSKDDGRTWSQPRKLPEYATSVFPDAVLMSNGVLAVSFGRPGCHIMFSVDGKGRRWTSRTTIHEGTNTDAYTAIREAAPGRLLYVYHEATPEGNAIRGVFIDVKRK